MRIAMLAPLVEPVPPPLYGGTERVVAVLTDELVRRGHDVTLFASGDSVTTARLVASCPRSLRLDPDVRDYAAATLMHVAEVYRQAEHFDVIHNHTDYFAFPFARLASIPTVTTTHGRLDLAEVRRLYRTYPEHQFVSISDAQRTPLPELRWRATVYNGIDLSAYRFRPEPGDYLVFLGRICPEKRPDRAIEIAEAVGMRLIIAAKVDPVDQDYYEHAIAPLVAGSALVEYIGEVNEREKDALLGHAFACLHPVDFPEPFGLTMAESMATGTPVIALARGSTPEVVKHGVTGFIGATIRDLIDAVERVPSIDRRACRRHVERHFSPQAMTDGYERAYTLVGGADPAPPAIDVLIETARAAGLRQQTLDATAPDAAAETVDASAP